MALNWKRQSEYLGLQHFWELDDFCQIPRLWLFVWRFCFPRRRWCTVSDNLRIAISFTAWTTSVIEICNSARCRFHFQTTLPPKESSDSIREDPTMPPWITSLGLSPQGERGMTELNPTKAHRPCTAILNGNHGPVRQSEYLGLLQTLGPLPMRTLPYCSGRYSSTHSGGRFAFAVRDARYCTWIRPTHSDGE